MPPRCQAAPLRLSFGRILSSAPLPWAHPCSAAFKCRATAPASDPSAGPQPRRHSAFCILHSAFCIPHPRPCGTATVQVGGNPGIAPLCIACPPSPPPPPCVTHVTDLTDLTHVTHVTHLAAQPERRHSCPCHRLPTHSSA